MFGINSWDDFWGNARNALDLTAMWNQQQIAKGIAKTNDQQQEWNQQAQLLTLQSQLQQQQLAAQSSNSSNNLMWVAVIAGVGLVGFMLLKK